MHSRDKTVLAGALARVRGLERPNRVSAFQLDYTHPINDHILEIGGKMIIRDQEMDYETRSDSIDFVFDNEIFNYTQKVNAVYLSTNINLPNDFSLKAGTRYEHTNIEGNWENDSEDPFSKNYDNILPNLTFSNQDWHYMSRLTKLHQNIDHVLD